LTFKQGDFEEVEKHINIDQTTDPHNPLIIVTNLPYGQLSSPDDLNVLYDRFNRMLERRKDFIHVYAIGQKNFYLKSKKQWRSVHKFKNINLPVKLMKFIR